MKLSRKESVRRRHQRVRRKINGTAERPRLSVFRSITTSTPKLSTT